MAKAKTDQYKDELEELRANHGTFDVPERCFNRALKLADRRLVEARTALQHDQGIWARSGGRLVAYWTGADQEESWRSIHEADIVLTYARPAGTFAPSCRAFGKRCEGGSRTSCTKRISSHD